MVAGNAVPVDDDELIDALVAVFETLRPSHLHELKQRRPDLIEQLRQMMVYINAEGSL